MKGENQFLYSGAESQEQVKSMTWQEIIQLAEQGTCNELEMEALKLQAQMRLENLNNVQAEGAPRLSLDQAQFEVDLVKKQVIRARAIESV